MSAVFPPDVPSVLRQHRKRIRDLEATAGGGRVWARGAYLEGTQTGATPTTRTAHYNAFDWTLVTGDATLVDTTTNLLSFLRSGIYFATLEVVTNKQLAAGGEWTATFVPNCTPWGNPFGSFTVAFPNVRNRMYAPGGKFVSSTAYLTGWWFNNDADNGGAGPDSLIPEVYYESAADGDLTGTNVATAKLFLTCLDPMPQAS